MAEDKKGLAVVGELADTQLGNDLRTLVDMKAVRGLSIGYRTVEADFDRDGNRRLKDVDLIEGSIVSLAMNPLASIEASKARLSSSGEYVPTVRDFEHTLRDAGYSKAVATRLAAKVFGGDGGMPYDPRRDAGDDDDEMAELAAMLKKQNDAVQTATLAAFIKFSKDLRK